MDKLRTQKAAWKKANPNKVSASRAKWARENPEKERARKAAWRRVNLDRARATGSAWRKASCAACNTFTARRRAAKLNATPAWADLEAIKDVYLEADYQQLDVDHIIPLQSKLVCGLHVWGNLQLLTKNENSKKGNKFSPYTHEEPSYAAL